MISDRLSPEMFNIQDQIGIAPDRKHKQLHKDVAGYGSRPPKPRTSPCERTNVRALIRLEMIVASDRVVSGFWPETCPHKQETEIIRSSS